VQPKKEEEGKLFCSWFGRFESLLLDLWEGSTSWWGDVHLIARKLERKKRKRPGSPVPFKARECPQ
jgi:hypothetical protein